MRRPYRAESRKSNSLLSVLPEAHHPDRRAGAAVAPDRARRADPAVAARHDHGAGGRTSCAHRLSTALVCGRRPPWISSTSPTRSNVGTRQARRVREEVGAHHAASRAPRRSGRGGANASAGAGPAFARSPVDRVHHPVARARLWRRWPACGAAVAASAQSSASNSRSRRRFKASPFGSSVFTGRFPRPVPAAPQPASGANVAARRDGDCVAMSDWTHVRWRRFGGAPSLATCHGGARPCPHGRGHSRSALRFSRWRSAFAAPARADTVVSLTFDDGEASQAQVKDMLASRGMHGDLLRQQRRRSGRAAST